MRVKDVAEQLLVSPHTVRDYVNAGKLKCDYTPNGQRVFKQAYVDDFLGKESEPITVFYTRSSSGSKELLASQEEKLTKLYGEPQKVYSDKGSGLNENRPGLTKLIEDAKKQKYNTLCITQKDRLSRFGYKYLADHLNTLGVEVVVAFDKDDKSLEEELMSDFMILLASFSGKFYRLRGKAQKEALLEKAKEHL